MTSDPAAVAKVDLGAVRDNVAVLRRAGVMDVVKADGYGRGAVEVARAAPAAGASRLGTASIDEALRLRRAGVRAPVLCWLNTPGARWSAAIAARTDVSAGDVWAVEEIASASGRAGLPARVHLKTNRVRALGTITNEPVTGVGARVARVYL
ncbi:alanine racemase [Streptomyces sp. enrichment culture]|uniref:alanine racemase n=1 Tax=Streptomyces sp. enrichment culture TaxID=1795815 RepID=UPI003F55FC14